MKKVFFLVVIGSILLLSACDSTADHKNIVTNKDATNVVNYGNGVYYFNYTRANFANTLSSFIAYHSELELVAITGNGTAGYGKDAGYFVVFRPKK